MHNIIYVHTNEYKDIGLTNPETNLFDRVAGDIDASKKKRSSWTNASSTATGSTIQGNSHES